MGGLVRTLGALALLSAGVCLAAPVATRECFTVYEVVAFLDPTYGNKIPRVGETRIEPGRDGKNYFGEGIHEVGLDWILPLHQVPRPELPPDHLEKLQEKLRTEGYDLNQPVPLLIMPDGKIYSAGGHHRIEAMKRLGESSIPSRVYYWHGMSDFVRDTYRNSFPALRAYPD